MQGALKRMRTSVADPATWWVVAAFLAGRAIVLAAAALAEGQRGLTAAGAITTSGARVLWTDVPILSSLTSWDGVNYLMLASAGYAGEPTNGPFPLSVFFPAYPLLVAVMQAGGGDGAVGAALLSNAALLAGLLATLHLGRLVVSEQQARLGAVYLALAAGGTAFSMAYTESLYLLVTVGALIAAERGKAARSGALFAVASVTRLPGVALALPLLMVLWRRGHRASLAWLLLGPLALVLFFAYLALAGGDPLAPIAGQSVWTAQQRGELPDVVAPTVAGGDIPVIGDPLVVGFAFIVLLAVTTAAALLAPRARVPAPYVVLILIAVAGALAAGRLVSADRYLAIAFPVGWVIAAAPRPARLAWVLFSVAVLAATAYLSFRLVLPP